MCNYSDTYHKDILQRLINLENRVSKVNKLPTRRKKKKPISEMSLAELQAGKQIKLFE